VIQLGVHYLRIESDLSAEKTQQILEVLDKPGIIDVLERHPIERITISRLAETKNPAWY
jgi:hypothetical protein